MIAIFTAKEMGIRGVRDSFSDRPSTFTHRIRWSDRRRAPSARDSTPDQVNWESREIDVSVGWTS